MTKVAQAAPMGKNHRVSSDSAWPLRGADGKTFAEHIKAIDAALAEASQ